MGRNSKSSSPIAATWKEEKKGENWVINRTDDGEWAHRARSGKAIKRIFQFKWNRFQFFPSSQSRCCYFFLRRATMLWKVVQNRAVSLVSFKFGWLHPQSAPCDGMLCKTAERERKCEPSKWLISPSTQHNNIEKEPRRNDCRSKRNKRTIFTKWKCNFDWINSHFNAVYCRHRMWVKKEKKVVKQIFFLSLQNVASRERWCKWILSSGENLKRKVKTFMQI